MQFPYFQFPLLGDGLIIALDAVLHVFISHGMAIGMVVMVVLAEYIGYRTGSKDWEGFARAALKPVVITITGVGAITGVGIWFITSGLVPSAIGSLLRVFFWPWFIEWVVFVLEVVVLLLYYFTWGSWEGRRKGAHVTLGVIYVVLACASAFLITGILGFMLTTDGWPQDRLFWQAFFNASFPSQLAWRVAISFSMGALFTIFYLVFWFRGPGAEFRRKALGLYARILAAPLILMPVFGLWWFAVVPPGFRTHAKPSLLIWTFAKNAELFWVVHVVAGILVVSLLVLAWRRRVLLTKILVIPAMLVVLFFVAEFERVREFIRGPYLMPGYMYANTILMTQYEQFKTEGMLDHAYWYQLLAPEPTLEQEGGFLFAQNCGTCHTIGGKNDIRARFRGRTNRGIYVILGHTEEMVPWMPPFAGNDEERGKLADFITGLLEDKWKLEEHGRLPPFEEEK